MVIVLIIIMETNLKKLRLTSLLDLLVKEVDKYSAMINHGYDVFDYKEPELNIQALQVEIFSRKKKSALLQ